MPAFRFTVFEQGAIGPWVARHGLTAAQYQAAFDEYLGQGYALNWVSGYFNGSQDLYAAIWVKDASIPAWQARHGLTSDQYQAFFNQVTSQGYKPIVVCGYSDGAVDRYAAIFRHIAGAPAWQARHGLARHCCRRAGETRPAVSHVTVQSVLSRVTR